MRIGLLQCDALNPAVSSVAGDYPQLIARLLSADVELVGYRADLDQLPTETDECAGWIVSGSRRSVYENLPWMLELGSFVDAVIDTEVPLVGLCFGHQLIGSRLGAPVEHIGWRLGMQRYRLLDGAALDADGALLDLIAVHQDQVTELPDGAELVATSSGCPIAGFGVGRRLLTMQPHPEFTPAVTRAILASNPTRFGDATAQQALDSLGVAPDIDVAAAMIRTVLSRQSS